MEDRKPTIRQRAHNSINNLSEAHGSPSWDVLSIAEYIEDFEYPRCKYELAFASLPSNHAHQGLQSVQHLWASIPSQKPEDKPFAMASPPPSAPITHIVLFKYRSDISWTTLQSHFEAFQALQQRCTHPSTGRPYILSMRMGKNNSWEPHSKGMTHAFVLEFASQEHLDYYLLQDQVHAEFSRNAHPMIEDSVVVDIRDGVLFGPSPRKRVGLGGKWQGSCHCRGCEWEVTVELGETLKHVLCHCDTCKRLGGGPYSCNYIVPHGALQITKGSPSVYTYKGASGKASLVHRSDYDTRLADIRSYRQGRPLLLLPNMHKPHLPPSRRHAG